MAPLDVVLSEETIVQPDIIYIGAARRSIIGERIEGAPDLVVEIVSPSTARRDRVHKLAEYVQSGVKEFWLVDPATQQIDFLVLREGAYAVEMVTNNLYRSPQTPELEIDLAAFWKEVAARK